MNAPYDQKDDNDDNQNRYCPVGVPLLQLPPLCRFDPTRLGAFVHSSMYRCTSIQFIHCACDLYSKQIQQLQPVREPSGSCCECNATPSMFNCKHSAQFRVRVERRKRFCDRHGQSLPSSHCSLLTVNHESAETRDSTRDRRCVKWLHKDAGSHLVGVLTVS